MILFLRHRKSGKKRKLNAEEEKRKKDRGRRKRNAREKQPRLIPAAEAAEAPVVEATAPLAETVEETKTQMADFLIAGVGYLRMVAAVLGKGNG